MNERNEMDGEGQAIAMSPAHIKAVTDMVASQASRDPQQEGFRITFHPTEGGPTVGSGVFIKRVGRETGMISGTFIPDAPQETSE